MIRHELYYSLFCRIDGIGHSAMYHVQKWRRKEELTDIKDIATPCAATDAQRVICQDAVALQGECSKEESRRQVQATMSNSLLYKNADYPLR